MLLIQKNSIFLILLTGIISFLQINTFVDYSSLPKLFFILFVATFIFLFNKQDASKFSFSNFNPNGINFYISIFIAIIIIGSFYSYNIFDSLYKILPFVIISILFFQLRNIYSTKEFIKNVALFFSISSLFLTSFTLISIVYNGDYTHQISYIYRYSFGHRNLFSNFLLLLIPVFFIAIKYHTSKSIKTILILSIFLNLLTVSVLMTRSSYLAIIIFASILVLGYLSRYLYHQTGSWLNTAIYILAPISFIVLVSIFLIPDIPAKIENIFAASYGSGHERIELWKNSLSIIKENPVIGVGTGDWKIEILKFPVDTPQAISGNVYYQRAHNDFLQIFAENGIIGLFSYLLFFLISIRNTILNNTLSFYHKIFTLSGIGMFITVSFFSFPIERIELLFLLFILIFPSLSLTKNAQTKISFTPFLILLIGVFVIIRGYNDHILYQAKTKEFNNQPIDAQKEYLKINDNIFSIDHTSTPISWYKGNYSFQKQDYKTAEKYYSKAVQKNPYHPHVLNNLASAYFQQGKNDKAEFYFKKCRKYHPKFNEAILNYSAFLFNRGQTANALIEILNMPVQGQHPNYQSFYLVIVKQYVLEAYQLDSFYNNNQYLDLELHCRYHNLSVINELDNRIKQ